MHIASMVFSVSALFCVGTANAVTVYGNLTSQRFTCIESCIGQPNPAAPDFSFFLSYDSFDELFDAGEIDSYDGYSYIDLDYSYEATTGLVSRRVNDLEVGRETFRFESFNFSSYDVERLDFSTTVIVLTEPTQNVPTGLAIFDTSYGVREPRGRAFGGSSTAGDSISFDYSPGSGFSVASGDVDLRFIDYNPASVPLPASIPVLLLSLIGLWSVRLRR